MYFKKLIILTALLIAMITISIIIFINDPRSTQEFITYPEINYYPGNLSPNMKKCFNMESPLIFCIHDKNSFVYDTEDHQVMVSTIKQENLTAGTLISLLGLPISSFYYTGQTTLVFNGNKMAIIYSNTFEPTSKVAFIVFKQNTTLFGAYKGFYQ